MKIRGGHGACKAQKLLTALALLLCSAATVHAQPVDVPPTWGGDLASRPRLAGDWDGVRDELIDYTLNVDTDKLGLWQTPPN